MYQHEATLRVRHSLPFAADWIFRARISPNLFVLCFMSTRSLAVTVFLSYR